MIYGVGTDICDIRRIERAVERWGERLAGKVLRAQEVAIFSDRYAKARPHGIRYLATRFAAKEAFSKAIGLGLRLPMTWHGCEIVSAASGKPEIALHGELAEWFSARAMCAYLSVTDETDYAVAFVVVEVKD
ncbi:MAG: holo-ACP synthase [Burkholderiaceae bacterium]|nr:holo-ACP synthase [Burkholderiaceae bacterium]MDH3460142.1 holo-ACP synthase [Burkholderiaceae bacterium]